MPNACGTLSLTEEFELNLKEHPDALLREYFDSLDTIDLMYQLHKPRVAPPADMTLRQFSEWK